MSYEYLSRHPTQVQQWVHVPDRTSARTILAECDEPLCVIISRDGLAGPDLTVDEAGISLGLGPQRFKLRDELVPALDVRPATNTDLLAARLQASETIIIASWLTIGQIDANWSIGGGLLHGRYLKRIFDRALATGPTNGTDLVDAAIAEIELDNRLAISTIGSRASLLLDASGEALEESHDAVSRVFKDRHGLRQISEIVSVSSTKNWSLEKLVELVISDIDSVANLQYLHNLSRIAQSAAALRANAAQADRRQRRADRSLRDRIDTVNRRLAIVTATFLTPGLFLAFWAVPVSRTNVLGIQFSVDGVRALLIAGMLIASALGLILITLLAKHGSVNADTGGSCDNKH